MMHTPFFLPPLLLAASIGIVVLLAVQLAYLFLVYARVARHAEALNRKNPIPSDACPPLSVVISAHEAEADLAECLPAVLEQDYHSYEVIVVNEAADAATDDLLTRLEAQYPHLYHTFTPPTSRYISRKKLALTIGIKASRHDWLVLTEAGCRPASRQWLRTIARHFTPDTDIVLGYSRYAPSHSWFARLASFMHLFLSMRYLGMALIGHPYMGLGCNLAYRKSVFFAHKGFSSHLNLLAGDDDLFVHQAATRTNTRVEASAAGVVERKQPSSGRAWRAELLNRAFTARLSACGARRLLGLETATRLLFLSGSVAVAAYGLYVGAWPMAIASLLLVCIRFACQAWVFRRTATALHERPFCLSLLLWDWIQPFCSACCRLAFLFHRKREFLRR